MKLKSLFFVLSAIFLFSLSGSAQSKAEIFQPGLISDDGVFGLTISPDGKHALWVSSAGSRQRLFIKESKLVNGKWTVPVTVSFSGNESWRDIDPMFTPDGNTLLFQSNRPVPSSPSRTGFDIWFVQKTKDGWGDPSVFDSAVNSDDSESYASMAKNGNLYFMKDNPDGVGRSDIYFSKLEKKTYLTPQNVGLPINTTYRESNPFISPDEDYLIYFSDDPKGFGEVDLYISFKVNGKWGTPINLGEQVNSKVAEFCPFYHKKSDRLYFSRQQKSGDRFIENTYFVEKFSSVIRKLRVVE